MKNNELNRRSHPELFRALRNAGYYKHTVRVVAAADLKVAEYEYVSDGGSRSDYFGLDLRTGASADVLREELEKPSGWPHWNGRFVFRLPDRRPGVALVRGGTFRGKASPWTLYVHPDSDDARRLLDSHTVGDDDIRALLTEAAIAGDEDMVRQCGRALNGNRAARAACVDTIFEARNMED